jgi:hypothetical protein
LGLLALCQVEQRSARSVAPSWTGFITAAGCWSPENVVLELQATGADIMRARTAISTTEIRIFPYLIPLASKREHHSHRFLLLVNPVLSV